MSVVQGLAVEDSAWINVAEAVLTGMVSHTHAASVHSGNQSARLAEYDQDVAARASIPPGTATRIQDLVSRSLDPAQSAMRSADPATGG